MSTIDVQPEPMILRMANAITRFIGFGNDETANQPTMAVTSSAERKPESPTPSLHLVPAEIELGTTTNETQHPSHKWRRHAKLRAYEAPLSIDVRNGRHEAVRGLFAARAGALDVATQHFTAAACWDEVDLTAVPGFWNLTRGQMQTAVDAYERANRYRDAAALDAQIQTIFRPSLVGTSMAPIVPRKSAEQAAN